MSPSLDWNLILQGTQETLWMVAISTFFAALIGVPLGVLLVVTDRGQFWELTWLQKVLGFIVNIFRAVPFIVLILFLFPVTKWILGTSLGTTAATIPLIAGAAPFFARMVETAIREIDRGVVEAAEAMGAGPFTIILRVFLPEAMPAIISGLTVSCVSLISYSAMAGMVGGGGLGDLALRYGFQMFDEKMMFACGILLVVMVQLVQWIGDFISRRLDKRNLQS
ncbi:ABC transporter permease [Shimazuella sp. AN120528]|uniref:methionine ABC transporter permease n=1 Tax=Shimazuella soli TaxID=1892854 RepID=UPI001F0DF086|nr:methionine ABC transporter permease [Shimazuella soli]MCH5585279.1 ABC transporter permease [Shimazuella soli]